MYMIYSTPTFCNLQNGVSDCRLTQSEKIFSYIMTRTNYIPWDDDVRFIIDQHVYRNRIFIVLKAYRLSELISFSLY